MSVPVSLFTQHGILSNFQIFANQIGEKWHLIVVQTCMVLIRRKLNIFSCIYWLLHLFLFLFLWTVFHILCPFLGWFVHIYSYWFVWALCKVRKLPFCLFCVLQISCTILSFVSWIHGIGFHKDVLIFMWLNSLGFLLCGDQRDAGRISSEIIHFREHFFTQLLLCEARAGGDRGWERVDGRCVSLCLPAERWEWCWVSHPHRPRTTLFSYLILEAKHSPSAWSLHSERVLFLGPHGPFYNDEVTTTIKQIS